ncbi:MAG: TRAP transporter large permease subunit [Thermodesulfobacteriota bacterium]|nr:TRAP transporter large permease subunit [Thermodesulfobacteriota bacterium]
MSPEILGLLLLGVLLVAIFLGFPISFTLIICALVFGYIGFGEIVFSLMVMQAFGFMKEEVLAAVPLFIFMGYILESAGLMERLFKGFQLVMGPVKGSLYLAVLAVATIFAMATGIIGAPVAVIGLMAVPIMMKSGYDVRLSAGVITAGGCLGILIPPSVMLVVMGPIANVSVVRLMAGALLPGVLLAGLYMVYTMIRCYVQPHLGPPLPTEERAKSYSQAFRELALGVVPPFILIMACLGSILFGLATPTEGAAMGAFGAVALGLANRRLNWKKVIESTRSTVVISSMVLFLGMAANVYGAVFSRLGTSTMIIEALMALPLPPIGVIILLMVFIFLLGWPLEWPAIVFIFLPMFLPVVTALGYNPLWFCILVAVNLQTAFLSPPVALAAYYLKGVAPNFELWDIYAGMVQFMVLQLVGLAIVLFFPQIVLWLPKLMFG